MGWPSKASLFWILIAASFLMLLLPSRWTASVRGLVQPTALLQWPATRAAQQIDETAENLAGRRLTRAQTRKIVAENESLKRQVIQQRLLLEQARDRIDDLATIRGQMPGSEAGIIIAPVAGYDADRRRASIQITRGRQKRWVRRGEWAIATTGGAPRWDEDATLRDLVHRGWVVGQVEEVHPHVARIRLATDRDFRTEVRTARALSDGTLQYAEARDVLQGMGDGKMLIAKAESNHAKTGYRIVVVPASPELPMPLTIGRVSDAVSRTDSAQHYDVTVLPWGDVSSLSHVYVISVGAETP